MSAWDHVRAFLGGAYFASIFFSGTQGVGLIETNHANFNRIVGNAVGVQYGSTVATGNNATIDVENNWWGCNFGPGAGGTGCTGTANGILVFAGNTGSLDANPWIVLGVSASPNQITPGGTSSITADMTHNSANAVPSPTIWCRSESRSQSRRAPFCRRAERSRTASATTLPPPPPRTAASDGGQSDGHSANRRGSAGLHHQ
jgi:hypothetical protein